MSLEHRALETEQGCATVGFRIHLAFDRAKCILSQQCPELSMRAGRQLAFEHRENSDGKALASFQNDVADKPIANHNFDFASEKIMASNIANETQIKLSATPESLRRSSG